MPPIDFCHESSAVWRSLSSCIPTGRYFKTPTPHDPRCSDGSHETVAHHPTRQGSDEQSSSHDSHVHKCLASPRRSREINVRTRKNVAFSPLAFLGSFLPRDPIGESGWTPGRFMSFNIIYCILCVRKGWVDYLVVGICMASNASALPGCRPMRESRSCERIIIAWNVNEHHPATVFSIILTPHCSILCTFISLPLLMPLPCEA